ncbi:MAG: hypothetical protein CMH15_10150 [Mesonia sp.]|nr:hypothetical protein [Mesonia sp.]MAQ41387.1 hypothetical protein [Mesonia sp.]MBJ98522.1 hypothetical protein [Flavobacteriaceae bacterium]|tara:strand:+ start:1828 stop:2028 length:201 start_codon:yes stop_codon:yes gene_type:complete
MTSSVQVSDYFSAKNKPNFLYFAFTFFVQMPNQKIWRLCKDTKIFDLETTQLFVIYGVMHWFFILK